MDIAKYVLENVAKEIVSILINGYNLSVSEAYECLSESCLLNEFEESPYMIMRTTFDDCVYYSEKIYKKYIKVKELE